MRIKDMLIGDLTSLHFDGVYCPDVSCGCLNSDLAPCGGGFGECCPGYRHDFKEGEDCGLEGCEGNGTEHWHIQKDKQNTKVRV